MYDLYLAFLDKSTRWPKNAKEFTVSVTHNVQNTSSYRCISKPVPKRLGNPRRIKFAIHDEYTAVDGLDE